MGCMMLTYCTCESPYGFDPEHDAGCRRCGRPIDFTPPVTCFECGHLHYFPVTGEYGECPIEGCGCEGQEG